MEEELQPQPEPRELKLHIMAVEDPERARSSSESLNMSQHSAVLQLRRSNRWLRPAVYTLFLLSGQSVAKLLGRLYFAKGGKSQWLATLVQVVGFPILLPLFCIPKPKSHAPSRGRIEPPSTIVVCSIYFLIGLLVAANCLMNSVGLRDLPVSTFSLVCATQLAFNAFSAFFINSQKFTPFIINSIVILSTSSVILVLQPSDPIDGSGRSSEADKGKYAIGFLCTIGASAGYGIGLSLIQLCFQKVLKREDFTVILHMMVFPTSVASCAVLGGLLISGEYKGLKKEMEDFELGKLSYIMTLAWTAVCWQVFSLGTTGLIFEVSSLFSIVISTFGLPIVPVLAAILFHEKLNGLKVVSMLLAIWGFVSYVYQHYLDDAKSKAEADIQISNQVSEINEAPRVGRHGRDLQTAQRD